MARRLRRRNTNGAGGQPSAIGAGSPSAPLAARTRRGVRLEWASTALAVADGTAHNGAWSHSELDDWRVVQHVGRCVECRLGSLRSKIASRLRHPCPKAMASPFTPWVGWSSSATACTGYRTRLPLARLSLILRRRSSRLRRGATRESAVLRNRPQLPRRRLRHARGTFWGFKTEMEAKNNFYGQLIQGIRHPLQGSRRHLQLLGRPVLLRKHLTSTTSTTSTTLATRSENGLC